MRCYPTQAAKNKRERRKKRKCGKWNQRPSFDVRRFYVHTRIVYGHIYTRSTECAACQWNEKFFVPKWRSELFLFYFRSDDDDVDVVVVSRYIFYSAARWWVERFWYFLWMCGLQCCAVLCDAGVVCWAHGMSEHVRLHGKTKRIFAQNILYAIRWMSSGLSCDGYKREIYYYVALVWYTRAAIHISLTPTTTTATTTNERKIKKIYICERRRRRFVCGMGKSSFLSLFANAVAVVWLYSVLFSVNDEVCIESCLVIKLAHMDFGARQRMCNEMKNDSKLIFGEKIIFLVFSFCDADSSMNAGIGREEKEKKTNERETNWIKY